MMNNRNFLLPLSVSLIPQAPRKKPTQTQETSDYSEFESSVALYIDALIDEEQKEFQPGVESFDIHAAKMREQIAASMRQFITSYQAGYEVISEVMQAQNLPFPKVEEEKIKIFDNPDAFRKVLADGKQIYELLGFSSDTLMAFYTVALHFLEEKEFIKAKDAFYFLTTLASNISSFWLSLAICYTELKQYEQALEAALSAVDLDPTNPECYLQALHLYKQQTNLEKANTLCDKAIAFASEQPDEPWAHKLLEVIEDAKLYINNDEF